MDKEIIKDLSGSYEFTTVNGEVKSHNYKLEISKSPVSDGYVARTFNDDSKEFAQALVEALKEFRTLTLVTGVSGATKNSQIQHQVAGYVQEILGKKVSVSWNEEGRFCEATFTLKGKKSSSKKSSSSKAATTKTSAKKSSSKANPKKSEDVSAEETMVSEEIPTPVAPDTIPAPSYSVQWFFFRKEGVGELQVVDIFDTLEDAKEKALEEMKRAYFTKGDKWYAEQRKANAAKWLRVRINEIREGEAPRPVFYTPIDENKKFVVMPYDL